MNELERNRLKDNIEKPLNTLEAAHFLGISTQSLLNLVSNGKVPYYKFNRRNRYLASELYQLVTSEAKGFRSGL